MSDSSLKREFGKRVPRPERLERMLTELEKRDVTTLPYDQRSKLIQHFIQAVVSETNETFFYKDEKTGNIYLDESLFDREVDQIVRLLKSMKLSDYTARWAVARAKELADTLSKAMPYKDMAQKWEGMPLDEKKEVLGKIVALQCKIFKKGAIDFLPSPVVYQMHVAVMGFIQPRPMDIQTLSIPDLRIHKNLVLKAPFEYSALTVVHEQLHSMFMQLAIAAHLGQIPASHPMSEDSKILLARHQYFGYGTAGIKSAYEADPEEKITFPTHTAFNDYYSKTLVQRTAEKLKTDKVWAWAKTHIAGPQR